MIPQGHTNYVALVPRAGESIESASCKAIDLAVEWDAYVLLTHNGRTIEVTAKSTIQDCYRQFDEIAKSRAADPVFGGPE